jgi:hypothetical protein
MRGSEPSRGHRRAMLGIMAGGCLLVSACGASAGDVPGQPQGQQSSTALPAATQKFCNEVQGAMASLSGKDPSDTMTLTEARATLDDLLNTGIKNFTVLASEAPANLRGSIMTIVADFRAYETVAGKATTVKQLIDSSVRANPVQKTAYQELLSYTADTCQ